MSNVLAAPMTLAEFLAWEERQDVRHEFDGVRAVAMTGGTLAHAGVQRNLAIAVGGRLLGTRCSFFGSDAKVVSETTSRYPDGAVTCSPARNGATATPEPVVLFEVLSPSTAGVDRLTKNREYAGIASVRRYVMLEQDRVGATVFVRVDGDWVGRILGEGEVLAMPEIGIEVPLAELYAELELFGDGDR